MARSAPTQGDFSTPSSDYKLEYVLNTLVSPDDFSDGLGFADSNSGIFDFVSWVLPADELNVGQILRIKAGGSMRVKGASPYFYFSWDAPLGGLSPDTGSTELDLETGWDLTITIFPYIYPFGPSSVGQPCSVKMVLLCDMDTSGSPPDQKPVAIWPINTANVVPFDLHSDSILKLSGQLNGQGTLDPVNRITLLDFYIERLG